ncbi:MAG TPA: DUF1080 domain-containing protein [Fimbriimonadaceae bacterium]|nr:DUF1080 domain-containing protein [Fimbriimonadaceae bacterium]HRJ96926.1 DUF1080 domain-containing protein [Fimbriimonadaceae bacterium]
MTAVLVAALIGQGQWKPIFNGKNLDGWTPKIKGYDLGVNFADTFRVEGGVLRVSYDGYVGKFDGRFGHLFYDRPVQDFRLRLEYRFVGEQLPDGPSWAWRNSGVMIFGQDPKTMAKDQDFPVSCEVQLLGGAAEGDRSTANVCTPGTHVVIDSKLVTQHCNNSSSPTFRGDQWVKLEVEAIGGKITHRVNGQVVFRYEGIQYDENDSLAQKLMKGDKAISKGTISLQSESHPVEFRRVELMAL